MEVEELKRKLMGLWEKTTHNAKDKLAGLFDFYFDENLIEYCEHDGKVVSAICGIPYVFGFGINKLRGLYVIPLSSEEGFRKKGLLSELFCKFNDRVKSDFDFTFLVPQTQLLADYYGTHGYLSSFFILEERYTPLHDFKNDYLLSLTESIPRIRELKKDLLDEIHVMELDRSDAALTAEIIDFIEEMEKKGASSINLCHTKKDLQYFFSNDPVRKPVVFVAKDTDKHIVGVAFTEKEDLKRIKVGTNYVTDIVAYFALLEFIKKKFADHSMSIISSDPKYHSNSLIQQTYASENEAGGDLDNTFNNIEIPFNINKLLNPLGMARLLRFENIIKYVAETHSDADFKLFIRDYEMENKEDTNKNDNGFPIYVVKNGQFSIKRIENVSSDHSVLTLSQKEVSELLLRKQDSNNLIMEAFGIPRLNLQMRLLPC
ncbi:MAG: hypothetical protein J1F38_07885 [Muribaculaceae bacterium]|nr:hypothetical protein [Muribaculaceae bacterium]